MDPDVDLSGPDQRAELRPHPARLLSTISAGGALGALARYGIGSAWPHDPAGFPWATWTVNVTGCLLIGVLMVLVTERFRAHPLVRPLLGVGFLGGYTTFSTYSGEVQQLVTAGAARTGLLYLFGTLVTALAAVQLGITVTRWATRRHRSVEVTS